MRFVYEVDTVWRWIFVKYVRKCACVYVMNLYINV